MSTAGSTGGGVISTGGGGSSAVGSTAVSISSAFMGWGDGWRTELAKGSTDPEKELKRLERFESPTQVYGSFREIERKVSSGEYRSTLKKDATAQEIAAWRKDNGIPEKPEAYVVTMPAGRKPPQEDDAFLKAFLKGAHDSNFTQAQVDQAIKVFYGEVDRQEQAITEAEKKAEQACEDKLRQAWGSDYRVNKAMAEQLLARAPAGFRDRFMNGFLDDHTPIKASPEAWQWLVQLEREVNPSATVVPAGTTNVGETIASEKTELMKKANATKGSPDWKYYWEGPGEARYRTLLDAEAKISKKAA